LAKYDFKGPKMAFQNIIFKEYLNLIYKNGQNYEITLFMVFVITAPTLKLKLKYENIKFKNNESPAEAPQLLNYGIKS
jgi:hypothetical protein